MNAYFAENSIKSIITDDDTRDGKWLYNRWL